MDPREVLFEGLREEDVLNLPKEEVEKLILVGEPLVFLIGSATLLGSFKVERERLVIELAQIEGGGEGVLVSLSSLARRYANLRQLSGIEWIVHAGILCQTKSQTQARTGTSRFCRKAGRRRGRGILPARLMSS